MKIYMAVTADKYELPLAVGRRVKDIADYGGVSESTVCANISRGCTGRKSGVKYIKIEVDD